MSEDAGLPSKPLPVSMFKMKSQPPLQPESQNNPPRKSITPPLNSKEVTSRPLDICPMGTSGEECLLEFGHLLGPQEMREILAYREVYFVGTEQSKKIRET